MIKQPTQERDLLAEDSEWDIVILGGGTAALIAAAAVTKHLPHLRVLMVRSTKIGISGVGEGTIATIGRFLHDYLGIDPLQFHQEVRPSIKLGIQFKWGSETPYHYTFGPQFSAANPIQQKLDRPIGEYCHADASYASLASSLMYHGNVAAIGPDGTPILPSYAYHLENQSFVRFLERHTTQNGVQKLDAIVQQVSATEDGIESISLDNGETIKSSLFIDCSGFRSELLGKALGEPFISFGDSLFCDRAVAGGWERNDETYYAFTTAEAMEAGWSWRIEHDDLINRGYVYSSRFISDEAAESEFRRKNPKVTETRVIRFRSGVHRRTWVKNVIAIGNSAGFVEPLEATAIGMMSSAVDQLVSLLSCGTGTRQIHRDVFNDAQRTDWEQCRDFLALHYQPNKLNQSPFWQACRNDTFLGEAQEILDFYSVAGPDFRGLQHRLKSNIFGAEGYLAMLVGQNAPHAAASDRSATKCPDWSQFKNQLNDAGRQGIGMEEYLQRLRTGSVTLPVAT
ncbi:MAG: tryptophan 7-halogenase [Rubripirellula sp.]|nr:tryptophan 7-halogenase [Rubripirellula sp.]